MRNDSLMGSEAAITDKNGITIQEGQFFFWDEGIFNGIQQNKGAGYIYEGDGKLYAHQKYFWNMGLQEWAIDDWTCEIEFVVDGGFEILTGIQESALLTYLNTNHP